MSAKLEHRSATLATSEQPLDTEPICKSTFLNTERTSCAPEATYAHCFDTMEQTKPNEGTSKTTPVPDQHTSGDDPWKVPLSALASAYPDDFILRHVIVPTALHIWWSVLLSCVPARYADQEQDSGGYRRSGFHTLPSVSWILEH